LIADEPTASLDKDTARRIMSVFKDFNRVGVTTVIASHDDALMAEYATRAFKVEPGKFADSAARRSSSPSVQASVSGHIEPSLGGAPR
jgi:cell division transport system ATP-binding protein